MNAVVAPKSWLSSFYGHQKQIRHTTSPQTHIVFIIPRPKGIGIRHKSGTGKNQGRQQTTPCDNQFFNRNDCQSKSNELLSLVIPVPPPLNS